MLDGEGPSLFDDDTPLDAPTTSKWLEKVDECFEASLKRERGDCPPSPRKKYCFRPLPANPPPSSGASSTSSTSSSASSASSTSPPTPVYNFRPLEPPTPSSGGSPPFRPPAPEPCLPQPCPPPVSPPPLPAPVDPFAGLPPIVRETYAARRGIKQLYQWQHEVLTHPAVVGGGNLVFSLPTSGGKSLVAEVLLLRSLFVQGKSGILIMPYVALVDEKLAAFDLFTDTLDFDLESFAGSSGRLPTRRGRTLLAVCTIEKANSLINSLLDEDRLGELGCVVVDELHMVGDEARGPMLELLLTKVMLRSPQCQIIGMSATLPNLSTLAQWLRADLYESDFRPVTLRQYIRVKDAAGQPVLQDDAGNTVRTLPPAAKGDADHLLFLVQETVPQHSCLIFCPTKVGCSNTAAWLAKHLPDEVFARHREEEKALLLRELRTVSTSLDPTLATAVKYGVAYHHAGLLSEERSLIERAYRDRILCVICCTSTLAAGVNLPARRVIIKYPYQGTEFLTKSVYLQMC
eukprot:Sspe_Gene.38545::Locus_18578_Transcript_2_2_Confidence_0.500_Length_1645::g.38545::m.38545/K19178/HELQ; POLQ-like helicase